MQKLSLYFTPVLFIFGWWYCAFFGFENALSTPSLKKPPNKKTLTVPHFFSYLSPMPREQIQEALSGNIELMTKMMRDWDLDAQILESQGVQEIRRLQRSAFIRAQMIGRKLIEQDTGELQSLQAQLRKNVIFDDLGVPFKKEKQLNRFLPQTFVSASFLLALASPDEIVALPHGMRDQVALYPRSLTNQIQLDTDRTLSEALYQTRPNIAFIADYSHPATLETLTSQGISLFALNSMNTVDQIESAIQRIGGVINRSLEAEVLSLFMESAMLAIDNQLIARHHDFSKDQPPPKVMFLNYYSHYSAPTEKTITGQLLKRLENLHFTFLPKNHGSSRLWSIPVEYEQIVSSDPDCMIISSSDSQSLQEMIKNERAFKDLSARRTDHIHFIDDTTQAPTQYIILAYYDLAQALIGL